MFALLLATAAALTPSTLSSDDNAVTCVRQPVTGSLVGMKKVCRTNAEWRAIKRQQGEQARDQLTPMGGQGSSSGGH
jgi:hypothetical protein